MKIKVKGIMNRRPPTTSQDTSIEDLIKRLRRQREDYLLVVNKKRELVGIVTESDILHTLKIPSRHAVVGGSAAKEVGKGAATKVSEIMTKHPLTVVPDMSIRDALNLMIAHKFRHLPVVERKKLVGLIAIRDILSIPHVVRK